MIEAHEKAAKEKVERDAKKGGEEGKKKKGGEEGKKKKKKKSSKKVMTTVEGTQRQLFDYYANVLEIGLEHSCCCNWTTAVMKRKYAERLDDEMIAETDFSADLEMRPSAACCATFYNNVSLIPYVIHYTDEVGVRQIDCIVVCSDDRAKNFAVHQHCFDDIITTYITRLSKKRTMRSVVVVTDNCAKQYRNKNMYGYVADFCMFLKAASQQLKNKFNITLTHFFLEKYHGKGTSDGICGLFKVLVRKQAWFKDSRLHRKNIMYSSEAVAEYGNQKFCNDDEAARRRRAINAFKFTTLRDDEVKHDELLQYRSQTGLTSSSHSQIWSGCSFDFGNLYTRPGICACDQCNRGQYHECLLPEETGSATKWYMAPKEAEQVCMCRPVAVCMV
jgi:hypothetical protein